MPTPPDFAPSKNLHIAFVIAGIVATCFVLAVGCAMVYLSIRNATMPAKERANIAASAEELAYQTRDAVHGTTRDAFLQGVTLQCPPTVASDAMFTCTAHTTWANWEIASSYEVELTDGEYNVTQVVNDHTEASFTVNAAHLSPGEHHWTARMFWKGRSHESTPVTTTIGT